MSGRGTAVGTGKSAGGVAVMRVEADGLPPVELAYRRRGGGQPLVLMHGIGHHLQAWEPVSDVLAADHDVIELDLPGFGLSTWPPGADASRPYAPHTIVSLLGAAFDTLGLARPHVVGNSLGGLLALRLGAAGRVRSVTAFSPAGFWTERERRRAFALLVGMRAAARRLPDPLVVALSGSAAGRAVLAGVVYARPARRSPQAVAEEVRVLGDAPGFESALAEGRRPTAAFRQPIADVPVTIAWGDRDLLLPPRQGVRAKRVLPDARLVRLPGCGHVPMNDDPATVVRVISDTVRRADTDPPA
ncbi:alpha/beta fold hydrolase [Streptomyces sp. OF8]|uniref:Alpha/beta fold hydrolase n=2 Tax=Streptomyces alkaliterrae TaxID=2213162 RepID=A0A5P0YUA2_9ACTN|nr:alpha/beta fold hydrolase [Streptomyces alkaliterrae]MQS02049.1 alpha/beta fold hydrolase [Streptomyces alkaliterrae]